MMKNGFVRTVLFASVLLTLASCGERASTGTTTSIPQVVVNCQSAACKRNINNATVTVLITQYNCDANSIQFASASSSFVVNCTSVTGCYGSTTSWVNIQNQATSSVPDGSYTICGRIDYNNTPFIYTDDSVSSSEGVSINSVSSGPVNLTTWTGP